MVNEIIADTRFRIEEKINGKDSLLMLFDIFHQLSLHFNVAHKDEYVVQKLSNENYEFILLLVRNADQTYPLVPHAVFEDNGAIKEIIADVWYERNVLEGRGAKTGIIKMNFAENCSKLPLHTHPLSERILIIIEGSGTGYYLLDDLQSPKIENIRSVKVNTGDVIFFTKNTIHTISTGNTALTSLTFHSPFLEFNDEKSFEKIINWYPETSASIV